MPSTPFDDVVGPNYTRLRQHFVPIATGIPPSPDSSTISICTIHDGYVVPFVDTRPRLPAAVESCYEYERDWGAHEIAIHVARELGMPVYHRALIARPALDLGRFCGVTTEGEDDLLHRLALSPAIAQELSREQRDALLMHHYAAANQRLLDLTNGPRVQVAVHTYGKRDPNDPAVSVLFCRDPRQETRYPDAIDAIFPEELAEETADSRAATALCEVIRERGFSAELHQPYFLPDGSVEVRFQAHRYFRFLRSLQTKASTAIPDTIWRMVESTDRASVEARSIRARLSRSPELRAAYESLWLFHEEHRSELIEEYLRLPDRTHALAIEIRRDTFLSFRDGRPLTVNRDAVVETARAIAAGIRELLATIEGR